MEQRLGKVLPPRAGMAQGARQLQVKLFDSQGAISEQTAGQVLFLQLPAHFFVEGLGKRWKVVSRKG
ncbi:hypothetical protein D3C77_461360 [compost metagenome]